jgi:hypothetical protein
MENKGISLFKAALLAFVVAGCDGTYNPNAYKQVARNMRGAWECMEENYWPEDRPWGQPWKKEKGTLKLDSDTITITGPVAHLKGFTRGIALEAYTEDTEYTEYSKTGLLYIIDKGVLQSPVSYRRWQSGGSPKQEMLTLTGGSVADETTLQRIGK